MVVLKMGDQKLYGVTVQYYMQMSGRVIPEVTFMPLSQMQTAEEVGLLVQRAPKEPGSNSPWLYRWRVVRRNDHQDAEWMMFYEEETGRGEAQKCKDREEMERVVASWPADDRWYAQEEIPGAIMPRETWWMGRVPGEAAMEQRWCPL